MSIPKKRLLQVLEQIAPTRLAESWDNVGLLLDIEKPYLDSSLYNVFLTIDLTPQVLDEAIEKKADFIISYHPSWFSSLKRLVSDPNNMDTSILQRCAQNGIPLFSPHTCLDTIEGGSKLLLLYLHHTPRYPYYLNECTSSKWF